MTHSLQSLADRIDKLERTANGEGIIILPQPDEPKMKRVECEGVGDNNGFYEMSFPKSDEPNCCKDCGTQVEDTQQMTPCEHCPCHTPHWESDYAAIWDKYDASYQFGAMRQDILKLIRGLMK